MPNLFYFLVFSLLSYFPFFISLFALAFAATSLLSLPKIRSTYSPLHVLSFLQAFLSPFGQGAQASVMALRSLISFPFFSSSFSNCDFFSIGLVPTVTAERGRRRSEESRILRLPNIQDNKRRTKVSLALILFLVFKFHKVLEWLVKP